jgi:hypothetical protein
MPTANSALSLERILAEAKKFGLLDEDLSALTVRVFETGSTSITHYPGTSPRALAFVKHLVAKDLANWKN